MSDEWNAGAGFIQGRQSEINYDSWKLESQAINRNALLKRIAELEAIVVQQRDGFFEQDKRIAELEAEVCSMNDAGHKLIDENEHLRDRLNITQDQDTGIYHDEIDVLQSALDVSQAENERLRKRLDASRYYSISLQRAIEYHCKRKRVPERIFRECPHHAAMLNMQNAAMEGE